MVLAEEYYEKKNEYAVFYPQNHIVKKKSAKGKNALTKKNQIESLKNTSILFHKASLRSRPWPLCTWLGPREWPSKLSLVTLEKFSFSQSIIINN